MNEDKIRDNIPGRGKLKLGSDIFKAILRIDSTLLRYKLFEKLN